MLSPACTRGVIIAFNVVYGTLGPAVILLGVYVTLSANHNHLLHLLTSEEEARAIVLWVSYLLYLSGAFIVVLAFCGCCCPVTTKPSTIYRYLLLVGVVGGANLLAALVALRYRSSLLSSLESRLVTGIVNVYGHKENDDLNTHGDNVFTQALDYTQFVYNCCGVNGGDEYQQSRWFNNSLLSKEPRNVPLTCCNTTEKKCSSGSPISVVSRVFHGTVEEAWQTPKVHFERDCQNNKPGTRYLEGCLNYIVEWYLYQSMGLIVVLLSLAVIKVLCVTFFVIVLKKLRQ